MLTLLRCVYISFLTAVNSLKITYFNTTNKTNFLFLPHYSDVFFNSTCSTNLYLGFHYFFSIQSIMKRMDKLHNTDSYNKICGVFPFTRNNKSLCF